MTLRQYLPFAVLLTLGLAVLLYADPVRWVDVPEGVAIDTTNPTDRWVFGLFLLAFLARWIHLRVRFDRTGVAAALRNRLAMGVTVLMIVDNQALREGKSFYETTAICSGVAWLAFTVFLGWCVVAGQKEAATGGGP